MGSWLSGPWARKPPSGRQFPGPAGAPATAWTPGAIQGCLGRRSAAGHCRPGRRCRGRCCRPAAAPSCAGAWPGRFPAGHGFRRQSRRKRARPVCAAGDWATVARMSVFSVNCSCGVWPEPSFLIFCAGAGRRPPVGHRRRCYENSSCLRMCSNRISSIFDADFTSMRVTPRGVARLTGPATSVTSAPGFARGAGNRKAHLAARQVGDAAHRVNRLVGRPGRDQHALAAQHLGREERDEVFEQFVGLQHAAVAGFAAGLRARAHAQHACAVGLQLRQVALRRRMRVHLAVHGRRHQQRHPVQRAAPGTSG